MKDDTFTRLMAALPAHSALAGIRAYILKEGMEGNLDAATAAFHQLWNCEGNEGTRAELAEFLVARYAYRGQLDTARNIYALLVSLGTREDVLQARAAALHILACMLMEVRLHEAVTIWMEYIQLPIRPNFKKFAAQTGHALLVQALKNSDTWLAVVVSTTLRALAQETGDAGIAKQAQHLS